MEIRETDRALITEDKLCDGARSVADDGWESLFGYREDPALRLAGIAVVENAEFHSMDIFLNDRIPSRGSKIRSKILISPNDRYTGAALPNVRFQNNRVGEPTGGQEILSRFK